MHDQPGEDSIATGRDASREGSPGAGSRTQQSDGSAERVVSAVSVASVASVVRTMAGRRRDWRLVRPAVRRPRLTRTALGPGLVVASIAASWPAFAGAPGRGQVAFGLFIGATSILLMAWTFVLSTRLGALEPLFGGLDRVYRVHRWTGALSVVAMFLHIRVEPDIKGGILGASRSLAESAEELAGVAEYLLYALVAASLLRWIPYRWWRWTHKLLIVPFVFACFHFFTAEKPYANGSAWGWWFGAWMVGGLAAYVWRVVVRDAAAPGRPHRVVSASVSGATLDLRLVPTDGRPLGQRAGQFAFVKLQVAGLREPHAFTIASPPSARELRFIVRDLGDWSSRVQRADLVGATAIVEGPYGRFDPIRGRHGHLWIAGGVGVTPFLAAIEELPPGQPAADRPVLVHCIRTRDDAIALDELERADADGRLRLSLHVSDQGTRLDTSQLAALMGRDDLRGVAVAVCGPSTLVATVERAARDLGATRVHSEDFDIRQGFGPDLSRQVDRLTSGRRREPVRSPSGS